MSDLRAILRVYDHAVEQALPAVMATVVSASGSTYRRPGARMILSGDGRRFGMVSGGCLEGDIARRAWFLRQPGDAELVRYDTSSGDAAVHEFGLGCRGVVEVLIERLDTTQPSPIIAVLREVVMTRMGRRVSILVRAASKPIGTLTAETPAALPGETWFCDHIAPPTSLVVFGSGGDVVPLTQFAAILGWHITVCDVRAATATRHHFPAADVCVACVAEAFSAEIPIDPDSSVVLMSHNFDADKAVLKQLLQSPAGYIGCLGPASRTEAMLDQLTLEGFHATPDQRRRLFAPIGLDIGADRPEEVALAIVAEIQSVRAGYDAGHLRDRAGPIHDNRRNHAEKTSESGVEGVALGSDACRSG
jgi:xanthine dehydrogenase accessory factor